MYVRARYDYQQLVHILAHHTRALIQHSHTRIIRRYTHLEALNLIGERSTSILIVLLCEIVGLPWFDSGLCFLCPVSYSLVPHSDVEGMVCFVLYVCRIEERGCAKSN